jgi:hypothetical protein
LVLSLSSSFLHFFFPVSAGFICKKMKAKTERDDELVRLVVLLRLPFLLVCAAAGAVGGVAAAALRNGCSSLCILLLFLRFPVGCCFA